MSGPFKLEQRMHQRHLRRLRNIAIVGTVLLVLLGVLGAVILVVVLDTMTKQPDVVEILDVDTGTVDARQPDAHNPMLWGELV